MLEQMHTKQIKLIFVIILTFHRLFFLLHKQRLCLLFHNHKKRTQTQVGVLTPPHCNLFRNTKKTYNNKIKSDLPVIFPFDR